jgi:hypothetical protein
MAPRNEQEQYEDVCQPQFKVIFDNMARKEEQSRIGQTVDTIHTKLFQDNGKPSLMTRVALLEEREAKRAQNEQTWRQAIIGVIVKYGAVAAVAAAATMSLA